MNTAITAATAAITAANAAITAANAATSAATRPPPPTAADAGARATPIDDLAPTLQRLRSAWQSRKPDYRQRRDDLQRLRDALKRRLEEMARTIAEDFGHRSLHESRIADGMTVLNEIDHLRRHLRGWMKPRRVGVGWRFLPARAETRAEPVGVVGVISPWNYPVNLALIPLATAIAAGNHVYLKPSEHTPRTSAFLRELLAEVFPADRVAVAEGGADVAGAFAALPFDHLVFTGSTAVGRKVMAAAAPNLTPLTLELGGKSPAIVCADYPVEQAAARLATGKWFNGGQTCIAPDYVLVPASKRDALVRALREEVAARYGTDFANADDYTRVINDAQYARLQGYVDDARARGLEVIELGAADPRQRLFPPTLVLDPGDDAKVMQEEIFGPVFPIRSVASLDEAIAYVNAHDRPLALYPFSHDRASVEKILRHTLAGGVSVNDTLFHFAVSGLPFGGIGPSGMGAYHGRAGFDAMGKQLPILWQARRTGGDLLRPPYSKAQWLIDLIVR
ncbi:MAG: coniferyl aldehyde dehydrogenase [Lysobacteraceae bacterium]|nr:MAG: coniferyl aldehyde dehydrogenase [Xanthomonadaceae bacterium]